MGVIRGWLLSEPSFGGMVIPARDFGGVSGSEVTQMIRIYFPRTYDEMKNYDFVLLASIDMTFFTNKQVKWMHDAIAKEGLGGMNTRSVQSMSTAWSGPWLNSMVSKVFPNDVPAVVGSSIYQAGGMSFPTGPLIVNDEQSLPAVVRPFQEYIEEEFTTYRGVLTIPRPGSTIHTWVKSKLKSVGNPFPGYVAHLFEWNYENATTFTAMDMVIEPFWRMDRNPYSMDIIANVVWHATNRELPEDALRVHALRTLFRQYQIDKSSMYSMAEFTEKFGANTVEIYSHLGEIEEKKSKADNEYLNGDFDDSYGRMDVILDGLWDLEDDLLDLKNSALAWVYFIEWLTVSGTFLICGVVIWNLMVRRSVYREVDVTRLS